MINKISKQLTCLLVIQAFVLPQVAMADPLREATIRTAVERDIAREKKKQAEDREKDAKTRRDNAWKALVDLGVCKSPTPPETEGSCQETFDKTTDEERKKSHTALQAAENGEKLESYNVALKDWKQAHEKADTARKETADAEQAAKAAVIREADATTPMAAFTLEQRLSGARQARCATALCWGGDGTKYAVEPVVDLPIGMYWALGNGSLANHINGNQLQLSLTAGFRYWFAYDVMSIGLIFAQPSLTNQGSISTPYSDAKYPPSAVSRPFPTLMLGLWGDVFMATVSYDQLRNRGPNGEALDPNYRDDEVLSRTITIGIAFNFVATARNALGAVNSTPNAGGAQ
ncbi:MAG: hypothetical protein R3B89_34870 [Polyangiaceae bacterium]